MAASYMRNKGGEGRSQIVAMVINTPAQHLVVNRAGCLALCPASTVDREDTQINEGRHTSIQDIAGLLINIAMCTTIRWPCTWWNLTQSGMRMWCLERCSLQDGLGRRARTREVVTPCSRSDLSGDSRMGSGPWSVEESLLVMA